MKGIDIELWVHGFKDEEGFSWAMNKHNIQSWFHCDKHEKSFHLMEHVDGFPVWAVDL
jgi:hypothetical protein